jgi:hypothetical protein
MTKNIILLIFVLIISWPLTSCRNLSTVASSSQHDSSNLNTTASQSNLPYLAVQNHSSYGCLDMGIHGTLIIEDNCVKLRSSALPGDPLYGSADITMIPIWPQGYFLDTGGVKIQILNDKQEPVALIGDYVFGGGGIDGSNPSAEKMNPSLERPLPSGINGPFWIVCPPDHPMELSYNLFHHANIRPNTPDTSVEGVLTLEKGINKGYIDLALDNGSKILPYWAPGTSFRIRDYSLIMVDASGNSIAALGDKIKITGAEFPEDQAFGIQKYDIKLPCWFVDQVVKEN